ncbi:MAG: hypothetical protein AABX29_00375 [Nanoarchaeota archaeon]
MDIFTKMDEWGWIRKEEPIWWDLDYPKDSREFMNFDDFEKRLHYIGKTSRRDIKIYTGDNVPVTTLDVNISNETIPLFITARPFTKKEVGYRFYKPENENFSQIELENYLLEKISKEDGWSLEHMFLPHVRGYFKEIRNKRFFYYPIYYTGLGNHNWEQEIPLALEKIGKRYLLTKSWDIYLYDRIKSALNELRWMDVILTQVPNKHRRKNERFAVKKVTWEGLKSVVYNEFNLNGSDLVSYYPVRADDMTESFPVAISTRPHPHSKENVMCVLGCFYNFLDGILSVVPFTNKDFAIKTARQVSEELGIKFTPILYKPTPGRGIFELITAPARI